jgi:kinesin family member 18/19
VAVRLRPLWQRERAEESFEIVKILDQKVVILMDPADVMQEKHALGKNRSKEK